MAYLGEYDLVDEGDGDGEWGAVETFRWGEGDDEVEDDGVPPSMGGDLELWLWRVREESAGRLTKRDRLYLFGLFLFKLFFFLFHLCTLYFYTYLFFVVIILNIKPSTIIHLTNKKKDQVK